MDEIRFAAKEEEAIIWVRGRQKTQTGKVF